ncbi:oligosaccharide flippase family protein [Microlunatus sp. Y2014]|uniref:oligosaccharide flippase family protein n=1 Tax=Microlunatus sp. Y2014 TaxID=3418488 RepID=UPI003DA6E31B
MGCSLGALGDSRCSRKRCVMGLGSLMRTSIRALLLYGFKGLYAILTMVAGLLVARTFGASGFGVYALTMTTLSLAIPLGSLGSNYALIEWIPKLPPDRMRALASRIVSAVLIASLVVLAPAALVMWLVGDVWLLAWLVLPATLLVCLIGYLQGLERQVVAAALDGLGRPLILCVGLVVAGVLSLDLVPGLAVAMGGSYVLTVAAALYALRKELHLVRPSLAPLADPAHRSGFVVYSLMALFTTVTAQIDRYVLNGFYDTATVGPYAAAQNLMNIVVYATTAAFALLLPRIAAGLAGKTSLGDMVRQCRRFSRVLLILSFVMIAGAVLLGKPVLALFGDGFASAHPALIILLVGLSVSLFFGFPTSVLSMGEHRRVVIWTMGGSAVLMILASLILVPLFGVAGAAVANAICLVASRLSCHIALWRIEGYHVAVIGTRPQGL